MHTWLTRTCKALFVVLLWVFSGWLLTSCRGKATDTESLLSRDRNTSCPLDSARTSAVPPTIPVPTSTPYPTRFHADAISNTPANYCVG